MNWDQIQVPPGGRIVRVSHFTYIFNGINFIIEVDESPDGTVTVHGEHSTDKNFVVESVSGSSVEECLNGILKKISSRI